MTTDATQTLPDINYSLLDPGICKVVRWLRERGFDTMDSGDGVSKKLGIERGLAMDIPHVIIKTEPATMAAEADRLAQTLREAGIAVKAYEHGGLPNDAAVVEATYSPVDGYAVVALLGLDDVALPPE